MFPFNNFVGNHTYQVELYPRRRATQFYYEPSPPEEYQSRQVEHPYDKLQNKSKLNKNRRIVPARSSDMRMVRNSYFS